ncbi:MAG: 5-formyltetrahydrofolate cyclo-ligase [Gammaproteobacteria bacterium]
MNPRGEKIRQRLQGNRARDRQHDRELCSQVICDRFLALDACRTAKAVMVYVSCRTEVATRPVINSLLVSGKCLVVPYCTRDSRGQNRLGLWRLTDFSELFQGTWGILEPPPSRWGEPGKEIPCEQLDLIMVPGVAFDRHGGRLGNGAGYYDRLLASVRPDAVLCGVCFESQLLEEIVTEPHDIAMDCVLTEFAVHVGKGR